MKIKTETCFSSYDAHKWIIHNKTYKIKKVSLFWFYVDLDVI